MNTTDYENIWQKSLIHVTDEFTLPPVVLQAGEAIIGTLGNFSVSTGKAKAKKTFNVSAIVAAALVNGQVLEYQASFPESKRTILYFDTEQSPYHCQLVMQRILRLAGLPIDREPEYLRFSHLSAIADPNERREIIRYAIYHTPNVGLVVIDGIRDLKNSFCLVVEFRADMPSRVIVSFVEVKHGLNVNILFARPLHQVTHQLGCLCGVVDVDHQIANAVNDY